MSANAFSSRRGQATLEYLLAFLILLFILSLLSYPTNSLYSHALQAYRQTSESQSLALTSLDLGMLHCAGPGLENVPPLPPFTPNGLQILSPNTNNTFAYGITPTSTLFGYEVLNVTHT